MLSSAQTPLRLFFPTTSRDKHFPLSAVTCMIKLIFLPKAVLAQHFLPGKVSTLYLVTQAEAWASPVTLSPLSTHPLLLSTPIPRPLDSKQIYPKSFSPFVLPASSSLTWVGPLLPPLPPLQAPANLIFANLVMSPLPCA